MGRMVTVPSAELDQDFRARSGDGEPAEVEKIEKGRRIDPPQRAVERERRQRERRLEALRQHDLENIAGGDVFLGAQHHAFEFFRRGVRSRLDVERTRQIEPLEFGGGLVERLVERIDHGGEALDRARQRGLRCHAGVHPHRGDHGDRVLDRVENNDERRANQDGVGNADRIAARRRQILHQADHVVAEIAEHAGRHRRQRRRQRDAAFGDDVAQRGERRVARRHESGRIGVRRAVDLRALAVDAEDEVGLEPDDRIAPAHRAAFDRFQKKTHRPAARDLQEGRDRRFQIGDQSGPDELRLAGRVARRERLRGRLDLHLVGVQRVIARTPHGLRQCGPVDAGAEIGFEPRHILADHVVGHLPLHRLRDGFDVG